MPKTAPKTAPKTIPVTRSTQYIECLSTGSLRIWIGKERGTSISLDVTRTTRGVDGKQTYAYTLSSDGITEDLEFRIERPCDSATLWQVMEGNNAIDALRYAVHSTLAAALSDDFDLPILTLRSLREVAEHLPE